MIGKQFEIELTGATPLLCHNDNLVWRDYLEAYRAEPANKKTGKPGDDRSPAWTWIGSLYVEEGVLVIPSDNLMTVIREGGTKCSTGKKGQSFKALSQSGIIVDQAAWPIMVNGKDIPYAPIEKLRNEPDFSRHLKVCEELGFSLFVKSVVINGRRNVRVRPRFDGWSIAGTITVLDELITIKVVNDIWDQAGRYAGLCDWRPSSKKAPGRFGTFTAEVKSVK